MMKIQINKVNNSLFAFHYKEYDEQLEFIHTLNCPSEIELRARDMAKVALFARPRNSKSYEIEGDEFDRYSILDLQAKLGAPINCRTSSESIAWNPPKESSLRINLAFSGGFDSVAAKAILPPARVRLSSISFGGVFRREEEFFQQFDTSIFFWDLRSSSYNGNAKFNESVDWRFLLSPLTAYEAINSTNDIATGTIMESSPYWFSGLELFFLIHQWGSGNQINSSQP